MPTAIEIAQVSGIQFLGGLLNFTRKDTPIFNALDAAAMSGTRFKGLAIEQAGTEPTFVNLGEGYVPASTLLTVREFGAKRINYATDIQVSTRKVWDDENVAIQGYSYRDLQQGENAKSALLHVEKVLLYGTAIDSKAFPGLKQLTPGNIAANALTYATPTAPEADGYIRSFINAGGTTSSTASSIYFVKSGPLDVQIKIGGPTGLPGFLRPSDWKEYIRSYTDSVDSVEKKDLFEIALSEGYIGLSVAGGNEVGTVKVQQSLRRIGNVTNDVGKKCTEALLDYGLESLPPGKRPDLILLSPRSQRQLRDSKASATVFLAGGGDAKQATFTQPLPDNHRGIPFVVSEQIGNTDAIEVPV